MSNLHLLKCTLHWRYLMFHHWKIVNRVKVPTVYPNVHTPTDTHWDPDLPQNVRNLCQRWHVENTLAVFKKGRLGETRGGTSCRDSGGKSWQFRPPIHSDDSDWSLIPWAWQQMLTIFLQPAYHNDDYRQSANSYSTLRDIHHDWSDAEPTSYPCLITSSRRIRLSSPVLRYSADNQGAYRVLLFHMTKHTF